MKKYIVKTFLFLLPIAALGLSAEYLLQQIPNDYAYKKSYLDKHSSRIQTLILGSSHAYFGLNPVYFSQNTFNASHISQTLDFDLAILNKYQKNLDDLDAIVLPISYFTLLGKLEDGAEAWRVKNYTIYYGLNARSLSDYSEVLNSKLKQNISRLYFYYIKNKNDITCTEFGWGTTYKSELAGDLQETGKTAAKRHTKDDMFSEKSTKIYTENLNILKSIAKFCNQRNIKLVFLTTPTYHAYRENLNIEQYNIMVEIINNFVSEHSNCFYYNWFEDTDFVAEDFFDADHLNEIGAEKLSRKLSQCIDLIDILTNKNASPQ